MSGASVRVEVHDLAKTFHPLPRWARTFTRSPVSQPVRALDAVSLTVRAGEVCAVAGRNGAGKTTLFRILVGLVTPTGGSAQVCGRDVATGGREVRRRIGYVPGDARSLALHHTARENLTFRGRLHDLSRERLRGRIDEVLALVDLVDQADRVAYALSSGMRARLQVACALLHRPPVLILDEPTASIDPVAAYSLIETVRRLAREHDLAVLLSTHRADEIEALSANVALLDRGRLLHVGDLDQLRSGREPPLIELTFAGPGPASTAAARMQSFAGVQSVRVHGASVLVGTTLSAGQLLTALDATLGAVDTVQRHRLPVRELLATVLGDRGAGTWEA